MATAHTLSKMGKQTLVWLDLTLEKTDMDGELGTNTWKLCSATLSDLAISPGQAHCAVFLDKTLYS